MLSSILSAVCYLVLKLLVDASLPYNRSWLFCVWLLYLLHNMILLFKAFYCNYVRGGYHESIQLMDGSQIVGISFPGAKIHSFFSWLCFISSVAKRDHVTVWVLHFSIVYMVRASWERFCLNKSQGNWLHVPSTPAFFYC